MSVEEIGEEGEKPFTNLEEEERHKYNHLVVNHGYGADYSRPTAVKRLHGGLGEVSKVYLEILEEFATHSSKCKVLDVGSGAGGVMASLEKFENLEAYGVDISDKLIEKLKGHYPNLSDRVYLCNAKDLSIFEDNFFELVQHTDGMEHIPPEWEVDCLKEAVRVSNNYIMYETALCKAYVDQWARDSRYTYQAAHINTKTSEEWLEFYTTYADEVGFKIVEWDSSASCAFAIVLKKINET